MVAENIYKQVVGITYAYLGPAADRFVARQIRNHLHKDPEDLDRKDLRRLLDWMRLSMSLLSDDAQLVDLYVADLEKLMQPGTRKAQHE